jgi:hypothetical protein
VSLSLLFDFGDECQIGKVFDTASRYFGSFKTA